MRAQTVEPALPWPTDGRRVADSISRADAQESGWSSANVARADEPMVRVAALLLSISQNNSCEGRDPTAVPDALSSGFVADLLGVDICELAALLVDMRRRGLIECGADSSLRLKDIGGLERIAN